MTTGQIKQEWNKFSTKMDKAALTYPGVKSWYIAGANMVLESDEYINMKEDADNWNNYNEELKSLQNKLSIQWEKVEKWDKLVAEVEKQRAGEENMYAENYGYIVMDMLKIKDDN